MLFWLFGFTEQQLGNCVGSGVECIPNLQSIFLAILHINVLNNGEISWPDGLTAGGGGGGCIPSF